MKIRFQADADLNQVILLAVVRREPAVELTTSAAAGLFATACAARDTTSRNDHDPALEQQVAFLGNIQRLLAEGSFVATYKHALLLALSDLSVELGDDSGAPLLLPVAAIGEKIVICYWRQALAYPAADGPSGVLKQNTGKQAAIIPLVALARVSTVGFSAAKTKRQPWTTRVGRPTASRTAGGMR